MISVIDLYKTFEDSRKRVDVLKGIELTIDKGEAVSILGPSGSGKSTFLHILGTIERPTRGRVLYNGEDIMSMGDDKVARFRNEKIGFVFQFHHLLPEFTAIENTIMPALIQNMKKRVCLERAGDILASVGLKDRMNHRPGELSGGEQQRVAVARALILNPEFLLTDEPTGNLDSSTGDEVCDLLLSVSREHSLTLVVVTHNYNVAKRIKRRLIMKDGKLYPYDELNKK